MLQLSGTLKSGKPVDNIVSSVLTDYNLSLTYVSPATEVADRHTFALYTRSVGYTASALSAWSLENFQIIQRKEMTLELKLFPAIPLGNAGWRR